MTGVPHPDWLREEGIRRLNAGVSPSQVAAELGVGRSTAYQWRNDPTGEKNKARKQRYASKCVDCGALTNGSGGYKEQAVRCASCAVLHTAGRDGLERAEEKLRQLGPQERITEEEMVAAVRRVAGAGESLSKDEYDAVARRFGLPSSATIVARMGWNAAVERAGLRPLRGWYRTYPYTSAEDCARAVRHVADVFGNFPSCRDYAAYRTVEEPSLPSVALVRIRCDGWTNALRMAAALSEKVAA